jgi:hypothetical protein
LNPEAGKSVAAAFSIAGFTVAIIAGLAADNPVTRVLQSAVIAMVLCYIAGLVIAAVAGRATAEHLAAYKAANPLPGAEAPVDNPKAHGAAAP